MSENKKEETNKVGDALDAKKFSPSKDRKVKVISQTLFSEQVVVVSKKIRPKFGPSRDIFNVYAFDLRGETMMSEKDAILFWKTRKDCPEWKNDVSVFGADDSGKYVIEYDFKEVKDLYSVETDCLSNSEQQTTK